MKLIKHNSNVNANALNESTKLSSNEVSSFLYNNIIKSDPKNYVEEENKDVFKFVVVSDLVNYSMISFIDSIYDYCDNNGIRYIINFDDLTSAKTSDKYLKAAFIYLRMVNLDNTPGAFEVEFMFSNNKITSIKCKDIISKEHVLGVPRVLNNK